MLWVVIGFLLLATVFVSLARAWDPRRPHGSSEPLVSILIPAYKSEKTIERCLRSVKELAYRNKEVIVVNDYPDGTPSIVKSFGYKLINNKERRGKAVSLNEAVKGAKGSILFFMDSDTVVRRDCLDKVIPWFSVKRVGVVAPKYVAMNRKGLVPRLVSLENSYNSTMFRMHMLLGSMVSFRGCGIAIDRSVFRKMGGWSKTLIEDTDFAAKVTHAGYKIQYEPRAIVETYEPDNFSDLRRQKLRWGRGAGFALFNNRKSYAGNVPGLSQFVPYVIMNLAIIISLFLSIGGTFQLSHIEASIISSSLILASALAYIAVAVTIHNLIIMFPERMKWTDALYVPLYTVLYLPLVLVCYVGGIALGMVDRIKNKPDLNLKHW